MDTIYDPSDYPPDLPAERYIHLTRAQAEDFRAKLADIRKMLEPAVRKLLSDGVKVEMGIELLPDEHVRVWHRLYMPDGSVHVYDGRSST